MLILRMKRLPVGTAYGLQSLLWNPDLCDHRTYTLSAAYVLSFFFFSYYIFLKEAFGRELNKCKLHIINYNDIVLLKIPVKNFSFASCLPFSHPG